MNIAIYSRKSKQSEKGGSIENQIKLCEEYAIKNLDALSEILIYEDEGFSGGNAERPSFQLMMQDAQAKKFKALICYRLDRISRSIGDFSEFIDRLEALEIRFISLREQFDTTRPMGRAMMYVASVFAQLERETIAERIRDNMLELAKSGRWLGGTIPTGYSSETIYVKDSRGVTKESHRLAPTDEAAIVKLLYSKYIELNSIRKLESYCILNEISSKNNRKLSRFALTGILTNPVYVRADKQVYNYFTEIGCTVYSDIEHFNGKNGIITYNKTGNGPRKTRNVSEWIIAAGEHDGIISSCDWLKVQQMLNRNKNKAFRKVRNPHSLLSGLLRCKCGSAMRPRTGRSKDGKAYVYMCELKEVSKGTKCAVKNINGVMLDKIILSEVVALYTNSSCADKRRISEELRDSGYSDEISGLEEKLRSNEQAIYKLISSLERGFEGEEYIRNRIDTLAGQSARLKANIEELKNHETEKYTEISGILDSFCAAVDMAVVEEKRLLLRRIIKSLTWDGKSISIELECIPQSDRCR